MYRYLIKCGTGWTPVTVREFRAAGGNPRQEKRRHWVAVRNSLKASGYPVPKGRNGAADFTRSGG